MAETVTETETPEVFVAPEVLETPPPTYYRYRLEGGAYLCSSTKVFPQILYSGHGEVQDPTISEDIDWSAGTVMFDGAQFRNGTPDEVLVMQSAADAEELVLAKESSKQSLSNDRRLQGRLAAIAEELNAVRESVDGLAPISLGAVKDRINGLIDEG